MGELTGEAGEAVHEYREYLFPTSKLSLTVYPNVGLEA